jgi:hypothetical protein
MTMFTELYELAPRHAVDVISADEKRGRPPPAMPKPKKDGRTRADQGPHSDRDTGGVR